MLHFDRTLFLYALYVGFVYSTLAFGALWFRQYVDDVAAKEIRLGEDMYITRNPFGLLLGGGFFLFFCIFALAALLTPAAGVITYVIPIACAINVVQLSLRTFWQTIDIRTEGILIRFLLKDKPVGIRYDDLIKIEISEFGSWYRVSFFEFPFEPKAKCHLSATATSELKRMVEKNPECDIISVE